MDKNTAKLVPVGIVLALIGYVAVTGRDGLERLLGVGDWLHGDDQLKTGEGGELLIGFPNGSSLELGPNSETILDSEVIDLSVVENTAELSVILEAMREAILAGEDPTEVLDEAAAGYQAMSEGGSEAVSVDLDGQSTIPDSNQPANEIGIASGDVGTGAWEEGAGSPIGGDAVTHTLTDMMLPTLSIGDVSIIEPAPGADEEEDHETDHDEHDVTTSDTGHDTGHDTGTDTGHDSGTDTGHDTDHGGPGGGGGYGYQGGYISSVVVFTVSLSAPAAHDVRVNFTTVDGTAISGGLGVDGADYGHSSGTLVIPAGQTTGTIEVTVYGDKVVELDEAFYVELSNPVGATLSDGLAVGTITDSGHGHGDTGEVNVLIGTDGNDILVGAGGPDTIIGGAGDDELVGKGGPDTIEGGPGDDLIVGLGGPDELHGGEGNDEIVGHGGKDTIHGDAGDDVISGGGAPDTIYGGEGNDTIFGEGGPDVIDGGSGNDTISGGGGPDILIGGEGMDILEGGGGGDIFRFDNLDANTDTIVDFKHTDKIDLTAVLDFQAGDPVSNYVQINPSGSTADAYELSVNPAGTGDQADFQTIAVLENVHTTPDVDDLVVNGNLIIVD